MATIPDHDVAIYVEGKRLREPVSYQIDVDILQPADSFTVTMSLDLQTWGLVETDARVQITIDDVPCLDGFVEGVNDQGDGSMVIEGRDRAGRLVDESIPGANYAVGGKLLSDVLIDLVSPWFSKVEFSNATDRRLRRGSGKQVAAGREPAITFAQQRAIGRYIDAGTSRWEAVERVLTPLGLLAWGAADGETLVVTSPNFNQGTQYEYFETPDSTNVIKMSLGKSTAGRFAQVIISGSGRQLGEPAPPFEPSFAGDKRPKFVRGNRVGIARDNPDADDGTGLDFKYPKRLFVVSEALSMDEAQVEANRAMARAKANSRTIEVTAAGHGQLLDGASEVTLYAPDTIARVYKEIESAPDDDGPVPLVDSNYYVTRVQYQASREQQQTIISMVPLGTLLI